MAISPLVTHLLTTSRCLFRTILALAIVGAMTAITPTARAQVVYEKGDAIWVMNDDGSGQRPLISASQVPSVANLETPDVFQNGGQAVVFEGVGPASECGEYCGGTYVLSNGSLSRLTPPALPYVCAQSFEEQPRVTLDNQVAFQFDYLNGCTFPISQEVVVQTRQLSTGAESAWSTGSSALRFPLPTPDPVDANQMAWVEGDDSPLYKIHINDREDNTDKIIAENSQPLGSLSWSPDGSHLIATDDTGIAEVDKEGTTVSQLYATSGGTSDAVTQARFMGASKVVFAQNGNIYTIPASCNACTSANATALTTDGGDSAPAWTSSTTPIAALQPVSTPTANPTPGLTPTPKPSPTPPPSQPSLCVVPKLKGRTLTAAKHALTDAHCRLGKVTRRSDHRVHRGRVLTSSPAAGRNLPAGSRVAIVVAR